MNEKEWDDALREATKNMSPDEVDVFEKGCDWTIDMMIKQSIDHGFNIRPDAVLHAEIDRMAVELRRLKKFIYELPEGKK